MVPFAGQLSDVARLYGRTVESQAERDRRGTQELRRWLALEEGEAVAVVTTLLRPDGRLFLVPGWSDIDALAELAAAVGDELGRSVSINADYDDSTLIAALTTAGFIAEKVSEGFVVPFVTVLRVLSRAKRTSGYSILSAADSEEDRLFELDNRLRNLVEGTDGWAGDREWFHDELTEAPPFDATAYLVAVHDESEEYVGLVRVWRNAASPRLGLVGVIPEHRSTTVAAMLLRQALQAASQWGSVTFETEVLVDDEMLHPRLVRYGGVSTGRFAQLTRPFRSIPRTNS